MLKKLILILLALALVVSPLTAVAGGIYRHAEGDERHGVGGKGDPDGTNTSPHNSDSEQYINIPRFTYTCYNMPFSVITYSLKPNVFILIVNLDRFVDSPILAGVDYE